MWNGGEAVFNGTNRPSAGVSTFEVVDDDFDDVEVAINWFCDGLNDPAESVLLCITRFLVHSPEGPGLGETSRWASGLPGMVVDLQLSCATKGEWHQIFTQLSVEYRRYDDLICIRSIFT